MTPVTTSPVCIPIVICRNQNLALTNSITNTLILTYFIVQNNEEPLYKKRKNSLENSSVLQTKLTPSQNLLAIPFLKSEDFKDVNLASYMGYRKEFEIKNPKR